MFYGGRRCIRVGTPFGGYAGFETPGILEEVLRVINEQKTSATVSISTRGVRRKDETKAYAPNGGTTNVRFMIIRKADKNTEAAAMPSEELITAMAEYNANLFQAGALLGGDGLQPSSKGARIRFTNGVPTITDGPFSETKELIAGYTLIQVKSREEALEWVKQWPVVDGDGNVELELRQMYELEDSGSSDGIEQPRDLRNQLAGAQS